MKLHELTTITNEDGTRILRVSGRISDRPEKEPQTEWISFQFAIDEPISRSYVSLEREALEKLSSIIEPLRMERMRYRD